MENTFYRLPHLPQGLLTLVTGACQSLCRSKNDLCSKTTDLFNLAIEYKIKIQQEEGKVVHNVRSNELPLVCNLYQDLA